MEIASVELTIVVLSVIANLILAISTLRNNTKSATNRLFFLFTLSLVFYIVFNFLALHQPSDHLTLLFIRFVMGMAVIINYLFFLMVSVFPGENFKVDNRILIVTALFTLLVLFSTQTNLIFRSVVEGTTQPVPGLLMPLFLLHTLLFIGGGIFLLLKKYKDSSGLIRRQIRFLVIGTIFMFVAILITNLLFVIIFNTTLFVGLLPLYTTFFAGIVAYAIIKHELFNVRIIAAQALTVVLWIILFAKIFAANSQTEIVIDTFVFLAVLVFGILLVRSVKQEVKQREKLADLNTRLKELDKQKNTFISMAAHELRAPMSAIKGFISMILEGDTGEIPEKARGYLADAMAISDRLVRLVNNMLNVSRIEEGRMVYQVEVENLSNIARIVFSGFRSEAERKGLDYSLEIPSELRDRVKVDPDRIHEVLTNLISNAVKYTDEGSVKVKLSQPNLHNVRVEVIDTGPGISMEEQDKLFHKFYRAESTVGKTTGTGLGLYICKLLVERFNGRIGLESESGKGSTFWFELPVVNKKSTQDNGQEDEK